MGNSKRKFTKEVVKEFTFSDVFDPEATNNELYQKLVKDLVEMAIAGLSGSFFVYGQTGSGKTYTVSGTKYEEGVFQMAIKDILDRQKQEGYKVYISTFEIYKEQIYDLLSDDDGCREALKIKEKRDEGKFEIENLTSVHLGTWVEFKNIIYKAESRRHFAYTYLMHNSSRSHFGIQINLVSSQAKQRTGQLTFFDLAGCEKFEAYKDSVDKNLAESYSPARMTKKERKIEGQFINKSVFFLDQVLKKLAAGNFSHIPFRSSAITKLLKNSLVGNNHTSRFGTDIRDLDLCKPKREQLPDDGEQHDIRPEDRQLLQTKKSRPRYHRQVQRPRSRGLHPDPHEAHQRTRVRGVGSQRPDQGPRVP